MKNWQWELESTGENLQYTTTETGEQGHPLCPNCGQETHYHYDTVEQDEMGNDIRAEWFACYQCGISTPLDYE